ncbi:MAG: hypothetical protein IJB81_10005 [Clostridia bacterium]|nr:hypothetical protein [Clostridia bacterium]
MKHDMQPDNVIRQEINAGLSFLDSRPSLHNDIMRQIKGEKVVNKKVSLALVLTIILVLGTLTALAVELLTGMQIVEQFAVPMAQKNDSEPYMQESFTHDELAQLIQTLSENGITLDEGSIILKALTSGHGYWEKDTIRAICDLTFGPDQGAWTLEQKHWYGEMMTAIGAWNININLLPEEGDISQDEAHNIAASALMSEYGFDLSDSSAWRVCVGFSLVWDEETQRMSADDAQWNFNISRQTNPDRLVYNVCFDRFGKRISTFYYPEDEVEMNSQPVSLPDKEAETIAHYGRVYHFWTPDVQADVLGNTYCFPEQADYIRALQMSMDLITERYGPRALLALEGYYSGLAYQEFEDTEANATQKIWDFMFTTDREYLSDGYRVQFRWIINHNTGEETVVDVCVEHANMGVG